MNSKTRNISRQAAFLKAFTFVEVLITLAVLGISLLALSRLQLININMHNHAQLSSHATFIANEKLFELTSTNQLQRTQQSGIEERLGTKFHWTTRIEDASMPEFREFGIERIKSVTAQVEYDQGD